MAVGKVSTFNISLRSWPCQRKAIQKLSMHRVSVPTTIPLPLHEVLFLTQINGPLKNKAWVALEQTLTGKFPLSVGAKNVLLDLEKHRGRETMVNFTVNRKELQAELQELFATGKPIYEGRKLYHDLLVIADYSPDHIKIEQNPHFSIYHEPEFYTTAPNLRKKTSALTEGIPDDTARELLEGDLETLKSILARNHPAEVKAEISAGNFDQILLRQETKCLQKILRSLASAIIKMEKIFSSDKLKDLFPFLPIEIAQELMSYFTVLDKLTNLSRPCLQMDSWLKELKKPQREKLKSILSEKRIKVLETLKTARGDIERTLGIKLEEIHSGRKAPADESILRESLSWANRNNLLSILPTSYVDHIARFISEAERSKIIQEVQKCNLIEIVKKQLLHILAEKESIDVSMFSFTFTLFAAAILSSVLRGAKLRGLLDRRQAGLSNSQYENLIRFYEDSSHKEEQPIRTYSGKTQHKKDVIFGSGIAITGSLNWSIEAFTSNLESFKIERNRATVEQIKSDFDETFAESGNFIPFSEAILPWHLNRAGITGIRFIDRVPSPAEVADIKDLFLRWRSNDFKRVQHILDIAQGKKFEMVVDLPRTFQPFMAEIKNPIVVHFLTRFLEDLVPLDFSFTPASWGKNHPGTTIELAGLIEHIYITTEIAIKLCKILGREDLIDQAIVAVIAHDTFKRAYETPDGTLAWGRYNPAHGYLAALMLEQTFQNLPLRDRRVISPILPDILHSDREHMSMYNKPEPTPLIPEDPTLKFIMVFADMLASRKYFYSKHRKHQPLEMDEVLHLLLNASFSIEGEALDYIARNRTLFKFIQECSRMLRYRIKTYADLPLRAKKLLRVAESLCDMFPESREVVLGRRKDFTEEEQERIKRRNEILIAALLYGTMRYKYGIHEPQSKAEFDKLMKKLKRKYKDMSYRQRNILDLISKVDEKLNTPHQADLSPKDDPALWVICLANCMMTAEDVKIVTIDEVDEYLSKAEEPKTVWVRKKFDPVLEESLLSGINELAMTEYPDEILPLVEEGLRTSLNRYNPKIKLPKIPQDIIVALIEKYDALSPTFIYKHFYTAESQYQRSVRRKELYRAIHSEEARRKLIEKIRGLPQPEERRPILLAQTALVNNISSAAKLKKEIIGPARDTEAISKYSYFKQMGKAVNYMSDKIGTQEKIKFYGDHDVDGQVGTAILVKISRWWRAKELSKTMDSKEAQKIARETIDYFIPHKLNEGHGLNLPTLERMHRQGFRTVISIDCGIKDRKLVARGKSMDIDFIITDHHEPEKKDLPRDAVAILNPKLDLAPKDPAYHLPGAAVAYKFAKAMADKAGIDLHNSFLDSVALAAIADVVPLKGENRAFVRAGLKRLNSKKKNKGLSAIARANRLEYFDEEALAYKVSPRLNVGERLGKRYRGMKILMAKTEKEARKHVSESYSDIEERRDIEQAIFEDAEKQFDFDPEENSGIAVFGEWHKGVIGIVASRLVSKYGVPSVTIGTATSSPFAEEEEPAYGSMRTIKGVSAIKILRECAKQYKTETGEDLFFRFGGHVGAAGFKIREEKIPDFQRIYGEVTKRLVKSKRKRTVVAGTLHEGEIGLEEVKILRELYSPLGNGFEESLFYVPATIKKWQVFGKTREHIGGTLENGTRFIIFFGNQPWIKRVLMKKKVRLIAKLSINKYKDKEELNLIVEDISAEKKPKVVRVRPRS